MSTLRSRFAVVLLAALTLGAAGVAAVATARQVAPVSDPNRCSALPESKSTAFDHSLQRVNLPYRTDLPSGSSPTKPSWFGSFRTDWRAYMDHVLADVQSSGVDIVGGRVTIPAAAEWWVSPWMDYGANGREYVNGLTKERGPDPGDLAWNSPGGNQVWAVGFYNRPGAAALRQVFDNPCAPSIPDGFTFPVGTISFKLLFTDADPGVVKYLQGSPEVEAAINVRGQTGRAIGTLRLLQVDIAVRDDEAPSGWVFGTYVWHTPSTGHFIDDLVPVGLMWGNDPRSGVGATRDELVPLEETRLNMDLAGEVWSNAPNWPSRPWPGFQGRLNGPADNMKSSCMSCHALAQWPRSPRLGILPPREVTMDRLRNAADRRSLVRDYMQPVAAGALADPNEVNARSADYSLQIEAAFTRMCLACRNGDLQGPTPAVCQVEGAANRVEAATCGSGKNLLERFLPFRRSEPPPRQ